MKPPYRKPVLILLALLFAALSWYGVQVFFSGNSLQAHADEVIASCAGKSYPPQCYDTELPKLLEKGFSMEEVFSVTKLVQEKIGGYYYCHVLAHNVAAKEVAKDPSVWTEVLSRCPVGMCSNGCLHGAAQERFRNEVLSDEQLTALIPELTDVCESKEGREFTELERTSCYHSIGHLAMYVTGAKVERSADICTTVAGKRGSAYAAWCYEGVYMQIFQPLEPEDVALVKTIAPKTREDAEKFCDRYAGTMRAACHRESWPLYGDSLLENANLERFCTLVPDSASVGRCYEGAFYFFAARSEFDQAKIRSYCMTFPEERKAQCFAKSASREVQTDYRLVDEAVLLCKSAETPAIRESCLSELASFARFASLPGSDNRQMLCEAIPEPHQSACLAK